jgi:hypothetical protein
MRGEVAVRLFSKPLREPQLPLDEQNGIFGTFQLLILKPNLLYWKIPRSKKSVVLMF